MKPSSAIMQFLSSHTAHHGHHADSPHSADHVHSAHPPESEWHRVIAEMDPSIYVLVFGIVSGLSLPLGAWLGAKFAPVSDRICAGMIAVGAGALLFAVTVELYGHALRELRLGKVGKIEIFVEIFGALVGALFYLQVNNWLREYFQTQATPHPTPRDLESASSASGTDQERKRWGSFDAPVAKVLEKERRQKELRDIEERERATSNASNPAKPLPRLSVVQERWQKVRRATRMVGILRQELQHRRGREIGIRMLAEKDVYDAMNANKTAEKGKLVAMSLFAGLLVDGLPEGVLLGFLAAERHLTPVLIVSLFIANFPEAFSSASLLKTAGFSTSKAVGMWGSLCLLVGLLGCASCAGLLHVYPDYGTSGSHLPSSVRVGISLVEGVTGGAMMACISSVMLPEAFERAGKEEARVLHSSGFLCTCGFLVAVTIKVLGG